MLALSNRVQAGSTVPDPPQQLNIRLPGSTVRACRRLAEQQGLSLPQWVTHLMELEMVRGQALLEQALSEERELAEQEQRNLASRIAAIEAKMQHSQLAQKETTSAS